MTAYKLIKEHRSIEKVIDFLNADNQTNKRKKKWTVPQNFLYQDSRELFLQAIVTDPAEIEVNSAALYL